MKLKDEDLKRELAIALAVNDTQLNCSKRLHIKLDNFKIHVARARRHGIDAVLHCNRLKCYSDEFKLNTVMCVVDLGQSLREVSIRVNVLPGTINTWIKKYREGGTKRLFEDNRGRHGAMGRKKKPRLEDFEPGSMEYLRLKVEILERQLLLEKKARPLVQQ